MAIPVTVPLTPLVIDDATNTLAESILTAFTQLVANGTNGSSTTTPALTVPPAVDPTGSPVPVIMSSDANQLFFRHLCIAIAHQLVNGSTSTFSAACSSGIAVGDLVYSSGIGAVDLTDGSSIGTKSPLVGAVISKPTSTTCLVQTSGLISVYSSLTPGAKYYASALGRPTTSAPANPITIGTAISSSDFLLRINP